MDERICRRLSRRKNNPVIYTCRLLCFPENSFCRLQKWLISRWNWQRGSLITENGMGGFSFKSRLLFPVLDEEKGFHAILGLEWGVCVWIWSCPEMTKAVSIGTVPFRFLLVRLLTSAPHSLVYFLLSVFESYFWEPDFLSRLPFWYEMW